MLFFGDLIRRRLASLLRPWLAEEPSLVLELGLVNSRVTATNITLEVVAINRLLRDGDADFSTRFVVEEVTVERVSFRFSNWSVPAFDIEVRGVSVTLAAKALDEEGDRSRRRRRSAKAVEEEETMRRKKALAKLDPEGSSLHDVLEKMAEATPARNRIINSLLNLILGQSCLRVSALHLQLRVPVQNDSLVWSFELKKSRAASQSSSGGCLIRGFLGTVLLPVKQAPFLVDFEGFEVAYKLSDRANQILNPSDVLTCVKLKDMRVTELITRVSPMSLQLSPIDLPVVLVLGDLFSRQSKHFRDGKQLWKLTRRRLGNIISSPRLSFHNVVESVCQWLQYLCAYEGLLSLLGCPADVLLKSSVAVTISDRMPSSSIKHKWEVISTLEKELPFETIAQARKVARYRAGLDVRVADGRHEEPLMRSAHALLFKILFLFGSFFLYWNLLGYFWPWNSLWIIFLSASYLVVLICLLWAFQTDRHSEVVSEQSQCSILLNFTNVAVSVFPTKTAQDVSGKLERFTGYPYENMCWFCLTLETILVASISGDFKRSMLVSCGSLNMKSYLVGASSSETSSSYSLGSRRRRPGNSTTVLWSEPALMSLSSLARETSQTRQPEGPGRPDLNVLLEGMWLAWNKVTTQYQSSKIEYSENPWLLYEIKSTLDYDDVSKKKFDSGLWHCHLTSGKLNLALRYSSIVSLAMLLGQMQHVLCCTEVHDTTNSHEDAPPVDGQVTLNLNDDESFTIKVNRLLLGLFPDRYVQLALFIVGPQVRISLNGDSLDERNRKMDHATTQTDFLIGFSIQDTEVVILPTSRSDLKLSEGAGLEGAECPRFGESREVERPKIDNQNFTSRSFVSLQSYLRADGLVIYVGEKLENKIIVLKPITIQLSSFRESVHSFTSTFNGLSTTVFGVAAGLEVILFMDELYAFSQAVAGLSSMASNAFGVGLVGFEQFLDSMQQSRAPTFKNDAPDNKVEGSRIVHDCAILSTSSTFDCKSVDIIVLHAGVFDKVDSSFKVYDPLIGKMFAGNELPDCGFLVHLEQATVEVTCEEGFLGLTCNFSDLRSLLFRYRYYSGENFDSDAVRNLLQQSEDCLYEMLLSTLLLTVCLGQTSSSDDSCSIHTSVNRPSVGFETSEGSSTIRFVRFFQKFGFSSDMILPSYSLQILIKIAIAEILMVSCSVKDSLLGVHQPNKLTSLMVIGGSLQSISWAIQGGLFCLETTALMMFSRSVALYLCCLKNLSSIMGECLLQAERAQSKEQITLRAAENPKWQLPEVSTIQLSQFSLAFILQDDSGSFRELILEVDARFKLESANMERILIFDLSRLSFISHILDKSRETKDQTPNHRLVIPNESLSLGPSQDPDVSVQRCHISYQNHILSHVVVSVSVQKLEHAPFYLNGIWAGHGSVSGFNLIISLTEIKMILSLISSLPAPSIKETTPNLRVEELPADEDTGSSFNDLVPDGAIVAIQDVHQHVYFAVDGEETKCTSSSVIHYSLVGDKALFRVKHHLQKTWNLPILWVSLTSLHAENKSGEPLKLRYQPGSGFVDISSSKDNAFSLWRALPCSPGNDKSGIDWEWSNKMVKDTFYLVNKKNDCGVAFTDGIPEFVKKPGNPFKFKVLHCQALARDIARLDGYSLTNYSGHQSSTNGDEELISQQVTSLPCIHIAVDDVTLTIVHELLDTRDTLPLLRCAISVSQLSAQIMSRKRRLICEARVGLHYFDAGRYLWRELFYPVDLHIFHRKKDEIRRSEIIDRGVPVHTHIRVKEFLVTLTEYSLDVLLFITGELDLAGPFSVRSSLILANCCKVENQSGLNLLCHFYNEKVVTIPREQSASVFLRYAAQENQEAESFSTIAIQLSNSGSFATSSLQFSLLKSQVLAWRTRITSVEGSRTYPGPVVVVDIARKTEVGVSVVVTPLVRIHNVTEFSLELQFRRPQQTEDAHASVLLKRGDCIDDSMAVFDATSLSGPEKKALMSLAIGNFLLSFRPEIDGSQIKLGSEISIEWSDELKGGKAVQLSGIFDKLSYKVRRALGADSVKCSFSTACCAIRSKNEHFIDLHFLIQSISREVPILSPDSSRDSSETRRSTMALIEQKEIFLLPTVRVSNFLHSEISVLLSETEKLPTAGGCNIGKEATISHGSTADYYANPGIMYFTATLITSKRSCKPVSSSDWMKKLKNKNATQSINIELDFGGGMFASLRLSRGVQGVLETVIYAPYSLKNASDVTLFVFGPNQKPPMSRDEMEKSSSSFSSDLGLILAPNSVRSWFSRSHKIQLKVLEDRASPAILDLGSLSGPTEISLETEEIPGSRSIRMFGISSGPFINSVMVPSHMVTIVSRHVLFNDSEESITVRQFDCENETAGMINVDSKQRAALKLQNRISKSREFSLFENIIRKHRNDTDTRLVPVQFRLNKPDSGWSGPVCTASLGRFFLKFRKTGYQQAQDDSSMEFAVVHVVEEGSTLCVHFQKPPNIDLPYLIENRLSNTSLTYYQKDSSEREVLRSDCHANYVWDDSTLPHKLVVVIDDMHILREINLDKVRSWKPFLRSARGLVSYSLLDRRSKDQKASGKVKSMEIMDIGYEVYAEGTTRVLRICDFSQSQKGKSLSESQSKIRLRVQRVTIHLLEQVKQDLDETEEPSHLPILDARLGNINLDCLSTDLQRYNMISVQSINVDHKWLGAPFVSMLRVHHSDLSDSNSESLRVVVVLLSSSSNVRQVKYSSIVLQPIDLNLDEETLMRVASFWRTSLSNSNTPSQQYYFDHFEIHPIKIVANFLPGEAYSSYNSSQEMLRSLLHSVVKIPPLKNVVVELNGVLVTHALITMRDLAVRCAQHYSWYTMRGIYIAKGSTLLPPAFASMFDDLSSSSLDVFFDPSTGLINIPGATIGTFKFLRKCIDGKGFSGTKRYFGDLGKSLRTVGSNVLFAAITEISDSILTGAETNGFDGMVNGFHHGILKLAMEPAVIGTALMGGGPDRKIKLDRSPGVDELYIEGYLQAMLDCLYRQEYLRVRLIDDQVVLKNLPPNSALISEIMDRVKEFLISKALLKGDPSASLSNLRHLHAEREWKIGPTVITLFEHLFVSFAIRMLRKQTSKVLSNLHVKYQAVGNVGNDEKDDDRALVPADARKQNKVNFVWRWGIGKFIFSGILAYIDGRLCRSIPNPVARRIVSGYLLSFLDRSDNKN